MLYSYTSQLLKVSMNLKIEGLGERKAEDRRIAIERGRLKYRRIGREEG